MAGAAAGLRLTGASAAPAISDSALDQAFQNEDVLSNVELTIPFNPFGESGDA